MPPILIPTLRTLLELQMSAVPPAAAELQRELDRTEAAWCYECHYANVVIALLSREFVVSAECEGQLSYAKDRRKRIVAVMLDEAGFTEAMHGCIS